MLPNTRRKFSALFIVKITSRYTAKISGFNMTPIREFDIREDEEQLLKLQDIIDLLVAAGYFRARIKSLPHFDKVIGGIVWCITSCNHVVDIDLFYCENATIGQKIALTEKVVEVLPQLKCPYTIEPYQIQGLDYIHIFPVVQWLVREAVRAKEQYGNSIRNHAIYQFAQRFRFSKDKYTEKQRNIFLNNCRSVKAKCPPQRIYKRKGDVKSPDLRTDIRCTLLEYGWRDVCDIPVQESIKWCGDTKGDENMKIDQLLMQLSQTQIQPTNQRLSSKTLAQIIDVSDFDADGLKKEIGFVQRYQRSTSVVEKELMELKEEDRLLDDSLKILQERKEAQLQEMDEINERIAEFEQLVNNSGVETVERLKHLLVEHDEIYKREMDFKANCRNELRELDVVLQRLKTVGPTEGEDGSDSVRNASLEADQHLINVRLELADLNRQIAAQQRMLDNVPAQIEISQYQRRIIELYNQMASKHRETKQFYILHNTLVDIKTFMKKEVDMLNNIDDIQDLTSKQSYKDSFVENLQKILKGVDAALDKISTKQNELQAKRDKLYEEYQYLLEKERLYYKTVDDFKNACYENEELRRKMEVKPTVVEAVTEFSDNFKNFGSSMPCTIGIDEAGRGPVLGPMVYACAVTLVNNENMLTRMGIDDSKVLTEAKREEIFERMKGSNMSEVFGYACRSISAQMISAAMLRRTKYSLNKLSHDCATELLKLAVENNINVVEVYVDTVGPKGPYQAMLHKKFPDMQIIVSEKADAKFPIVSAASIIAKVKRDRALRNWTFPEGIVNVLPGGYGSGYPGGLIKCLGTQIWCDSVGRQPKFCYKERQSNAENAPGSTITSFFKPCSSGKKYSMKSRFFADRYLSNILKCSDF
uniref:Ribonuclease n=1 Tax=Wuchereria bancrofti TaxID=6293 RepID=A0A1I8EYT0_WUCBA